MIYDHCSRGKSWIQDRHLSLLHIGCRQLKLNKAAFNLRIYGWSAETRRALRVINETRSTATISGEPIGLILYRRSSSNRDSPSERMGIDVLVMKRECYLIGDSVSQKNLSGQRWSNRFWV
ncbi:Uncharacterized protein HZ326_7598 [Fusarium oxysporum f. sp. albedinis]|nr:Uncharacterized protein HZ326_7598 [Fusarium oxysporum f. sp. albedinis]